LIFFDRVAENNCCTNILIDNKRAAYDATRHLIAEGCKKIMHITATSKRNVYIDRLNGYKQALQESNLRFNEKLLIINDLSQEAGMTAAALILKLDTLPDGVFVANDNCAVGCMAGL